MNYHETYLKSSQRYFVNIQRKTNFWLEKPPIAVIAFRVEYPNRMRMDGKFY